MFIDTHCHLDDPAFTSRLDEVIAAARSAGVGRFVVPGVAPEGWPGIMALARSQAGVHPAIGLHPMVAERFSAGLLSELAELGRSVVAFGEIGLDYALAEPAREAQQTAFREQLRLAIRLDKPVLIHCRRAFQDLLRILREEHVERVGGIMHAFSGSPEVARECIGLGLAISVAGPVTWENAVRPVEVASQVPSEWLVLETDAPDMTPEPHRGMDNEPRFLLEIARRVAEIRGMSMEELAELTTRNAERVLRLDGMIGMK
ncbi:MAG: TatD family hydrolase [Geobacter sp.]|nr:TatD family hydrolase [Geobacter sp.]